MDSDDDLMVPPRPAPKAAAISLDDSDDDLMVAPKAVVAPAAAGPASPTGGKGPAVTLEDSDDDLLPPAPGMNNSMASPKGPPMGQSFHRDPTGPVSPNATPAPASFNGSMTYSAGAVAEALNRTRTFVKRQQEKHGFLSKLQPTWPYSPQRRWCVLQGRMFSYYDNQTSTKPSATLDLKGAEIVLDPEGAREPNSFGIANIESGNSGNGGAAALKGRVFIFSAPTKDEMTQWVDALRGVLSDGHSEVHWFEKMAQGAY